jgi:site-specific recombinase
LEILNTYNDAIKKKFLKTLGIEIIQFLDNDFQDNFAQKLYDFLEKKVILADQSEVSLLDLIKQLDWYWFFTQVGLNQGMSFFTETYRRIEEGFLPSLVDSHEIVWFVEALFSKETEKLINTKQNTIKKIDFTFLEQKPVIPVFLQQSLFLAILNLSQRISGLAFDPIIAKRIRHNNDFIESFLALGRIRFDNSSAEIKQNYLKTLSNCEEALIYIQSLSKEEGVSLSLTYRLLQIEQLMDRLIILIHLIDQNKENNNQKGLAEACSIILQNHFDNIKLRQFLIRNIEILAYQITVLSQRTGEHYVSKDSKELSDMWFKAIKGAFVVALLVFIKVQLAKFGYPPLIEAFTFGSLYAIGFVLIHLTGGVLATKQPAMTASTLAAAMDKTNSSQDSLHNLSDSIINILRTQIAALLGNYLFAFPFALLLSLPFFLTNHKVVDYHKAESLIDSLHPLLSFSLIYAAIAGVCLFLSGIIAGLASNWFAFHKIADRLKYRFSSARSHRFIHFLNENFGILMGNIILGYMLGSMSSWGKMLGIPLDIRHVTFASGSFAIGWSNKADLMSWQNFCVIALGVILIGLVNLTVSFSLSLLVAMKSRRLKITQGRLIFKIVLKKLIKNPGQIFRHVK